MPDCDLVVFDLDGTLVDSQQDLVYSVNVTLESLGRSPLEPGHVASFIGDGAAMLVRRALEATGEMDEALLSHALSAFLAFYWKHMLDTTRPYCGVMEALGAIRDAMPDLPMAVLTNKPVRPSRAICDALSLKPYFFQVYGGNSFTTKKPHPLGMETLMAEASSIAGRPVRRQHAVLVGDSHVDAETAGAAGVLCLGCLYGLDPERLRASTPDVLVDCPGEWLPMLNRLLG